MDLEYLQSISRKNHFCTQFRSIKSIGKGAFGRIFSAVNKLDLQTYAIKQVIIKSQTFCKKKIEDTLKELHILAKFDHENIVRYKTSWIEQIDNTDLKGHVDDFSESGSMISSNRSFSASTSADESDLFSSGNSKSSIVFEEKSRDNNAIPGISDLDINSNDSEIDFALYIQMELCEYNLRYWLELRNELPGSLLPLDKKNVRCLSRQLLKGVDYIHSKKIMHRDIKPANIFLRNHDTHNLQLRIGDFGFSKLFEYDIADGISVLPTPNLSPNIGTSLYMAPEIESEDKLTKYNHKCDLYSVGIVLMELMAKFKTVTELYRVLTNMLNGSMYEDLVEMWPLEASHVMNLVSLRPEIRPEAKFLLNETLYFMEEND